MNNKEISDLAFERLRLRTFPVAVKFLKPGEGFPEKTRRPSQMLGKRVAICQAVTMARLYGWQIGLGREDVICVPGSFAFGFSNLDDASEGIVRLFCEGAYSSGPEAAKAEAKSIHKLGRGEYGGIVLAPLARASFEPDVAVFYGNPAQIMRLVQAFSCAKGERVPGNFGGKIECSEYLLAPFKLKAPRVAIPGMGDRVFSMTQDDELVFSVPGSLLPQVADGLTKAGARVGAQYPVPFYLNFEPEFPKAFKVIGEESGVL
jgi:uncharacterized protein (DUF169 family)